MIALLTVFQAALAARLVQVPRFFPTQLVSTADGRAAMVWKQVGRTVTVRVGSGEQIDLDAMQLEVIADRRLAA